MTTTTNVKLSTPAHGANVDTWDADPINNNSAILDAIFGSVTSKALTNAPVTLSATEAQVSVLRFSGALSGNVAVNVSAIRKSWFIENTCTGAFVVTLTGGSGNVIGVPPGSSQAYWDGTNMSFINLGKVGFPEQFFGAAVPAWVTACTVPPYLLLDGSSFSSGTYPLLASILGTTTLPDARGRSIISLDGGTGRVTTAGSGIDGATRFSAGGTQDVTLTLGQIARHAHTVIDSGHSHPVKYSIGGSGPTPVPVAVTGINPGNPVGGNSDPATTGITLGQSGNDEAHRNMQPTLVGGIVMVRAA